MSYTAEDQQLVIQDSSSEIYTYYILNENEEVVSQGILDFSGNGSYTIDLGLCCSGEYELVVVYNDHVFSGTFDIDE